VNTPGLREAKRQATSHALAWAAFDLAREHGIDAITVDDITDKAGYSRRTFANHFSCKEQAVAAVALEQLREGLESLPEIADDLPLLDWLAALARHQIRAGLFTRLLELKELCRTSPSLQPYLLEVQREIRLIGQTAIAGRADGAVSGIYIRILAGAVYGAIMSLLDGSSPLRLPGDLGATPDPEDVPGLVDTVFAHLRDGF
jgi:AcrR family transcriptional regulator